jgi:Cft2 family RNA processing exonuclease
VASVRAISGAGGKGPACFLVDTGDARLLLDLGYGPQQGLWPDVSSVGRVDAIVLTHGHNDHAAGLKLADQLGNPPVHATKTVIAALKTRLETRELPLNGTATVCGIAVHTGRNGHAPGGVWLHLDVGAGLLYTGDYSVESLIYEFDPPPEAGALVLDASYGVYDESLETCMAKLAPMLGEGPALLPVPVLGRGPEIAYHLARERNELPRIGDDLRNAICGMVAAPHQHNVRSAVLAALEHLANEAPALDDAADLLITGPADGSGGESARVIAQWEATHDRAIVFTGYVPPGTPAQRLVDSGRAQYARWNVHPRLRDNAALVRATKPRTVLPAFGDRRHRAAWEQAFSPARIVIEETIEL